MVKTTLEIDGMMCSMCEAHVSEAVRNNFKVKKVSSSHTKGNCEIISEQPIDREKLTKALGDIGYKLISVSEEPYEKKKFSLFHR